MSLNLENYIASIPGFPKEGILFRDVTPIYLTQKHTKKQFVYSVTMLKKLAQQRLLDQKQEDSGLDVQ